MGSQLPDESADPEPSEAERRGTRRWSPNAVAIAVLLALVLAVVLWRQPWRDIANHPGAEPSALADDAAAVLTDRAQQLSNSRTQADFAQALGPDPRAQRWATDLAGAIEGLAVDPARWRYLSGGDRSLLDGDGRADFEVQWGSDRRAAFTVALRSSPDGELSLTGVVDATDPLPVWLAGAIDVERVRDVTIVCVGRNALNLDLSRAVRVARQQVKQVVSDADDELTVIAAPSAQVAGFLLGRRPADIRQIAGVATSRDNRDGDAGSRAVVLNPEQFEQMDARAAQVVLTHEATHVMTTAVDADAEPWVVEGFADFVALRKDKAPLKVSADRILKQVAGTGVPAQLPTRKQFESQASGLSAVYESSWMAMRALGAKHSEADLLRFYRLVLRGQAVDAAAKTALGESTESITALWRRSLRAEADKAQPTD